MRTKTLLVLGFLMLGFFSQVSGDEIDSKLLKIRESLPSEEDFKRTAIDSSLKRRERMRDVEEAKLIVKETHITKEKQKVLHSALKFHQERLSRWERLRDMLAEENVIAGTLTPPEDKLSDTEALENVLREVTGKIKENRETVRLIGSRLKEDG